MGEVIPFYDKWKLDSGQDDEKTVGKCEHCDREIYEGDEIYETSEGDVHEDCFQEFAETALDATLKHAEKRHR